MFGGNYFGSNYFGQFNSNIFNRVVAAIATMLKSKGGPIFMRVRGK